MRKVYVHGGVTEERVYLGAFEIYRNRNAASRAISLERTTLHVMDDKARVALAETTTVDTSVAAFTPTSRTRYQLAEQLGSSVFELDDTAGVITYEEYFAFGGTAFHAADSTTDVSAKRYRYVGLERDEETGLDYATARYYAAWLGRWTASDPISLQGGANQYQYCGNNPITRTDPAGTSLFDWFNPRNWCNPFSSDCAVFPLEVSAAAGDAAISVATDTWKRLVFGQAVVWALAYDSTQGLLANIGTGLYNNTVGGPIAITKGVLNGEPAAFGQLGLMMMIGRVAGSPGGGGGSPGATLSFRVPWVAEAVSDGGGRVPVLVSKVVSVTIPASQAQAAVAAGVPMMAIAGGGGGKSGSNAHHIATDKNTVSDARGGPWTPRFKIFFDNADLDIRTADENLVDVLDHVGPHPEAYHSYVLREIRTAVAKLKPHTASYREALVGTLKRIAHEAQTPGSLVNRWLTKK